MNLKKTINLIALAILPFIWIACGSSGSTTNASVTFTIDDITSTSQKKMLESGDNISEVDVVDLEGNSIGTISHLELRTYTLEIQEGIPYIIQAVIKNGNNGEFELEALVEKATTEAVQVNRTSTEIATIIRERARDHQLHIKNFIEENQDQAEDVEKDIADIQGREFINNALENLGNAESLEDVAKQLAQIIEQLERITHIIETIKENMDRFNEGSEESFHHYNFYENEERPLSTEDLANHLGGAQNGGTGEEKEFDIEISEEGEVVVRNGENAEHIDTDLASSSIVKGEILGVNEEVIELGVITDSGIKESRFVNPGTNPLIKEILMSLHEGEEIAVKFEADGDKKIIVNIFGRGVTTGVIIEKGDAFIVVEDAKGNQTKFTPRWIESDEKENENHDSDNESEEEQSEADNSSDETSSSTETNDGDSPTVDESKDSNKKSKGQLDPEILEFFEKLSIGDNVAVIWEIEERKRIIDIKWTEKFELNHENENDTEETTNPTNDSIPKRTFGKISEKGDNFFIISGNANDADADPELTKITIDTNIAYHKEILDSLLINDEVFASYVVKNEIKVLKSMTGEGIFSGTIIQITDESIYIKDVDGNAIRFTPKWVKNIETLAISQNGGLDPEMLEIFKTLELNTTVSVKWVLDERKRVVEITKENSSDTTKDTITD